MNQKQMNQLKMRYILKTVGIHTVKHQGIEYQATKQMKQMKKKLTYGLVVYLLVASIINSMLLALPLFEESIMLSLGLMIVIYSGFFYLWLSTSARRLPDFEEPK